MEVPFTEMSSVNLLVRNRTTKRVPRFVIGISAIALALAGSILYTAFSAGPAVGNKMFQQSLYQTERPSDIAFWNDAHFMGEFENFMKQYAKKYDSADEKLLRFKVYKKNLVYIHTHNSQKHTYSLAPNAYSDLTTEEFRRYFLNSKVKRKDSSGDRVDWDLLEVDEATLPSSMDWRKKGCVTPVKDQAQCGSCWSFATTGSIEGAICATTGVLRSLSEQQLVDCASPEGNLGCNGGEADWAFQYVIDSGGLCSESSYSYHGKDGAYCKAHDCPIVGQINNFRDVPPRSELALKAALKKYGPVAVAIEADQSAFHFYHSGVMGGTCGTQLDHAVLVVGYGTDERTGEDYWIIKNSWGGSWGEEGYIRLSREVHRRSGECGVLLQASFPVHKNEFGAKKEG